MHTLFLGDFIHFENTYIDIVIFSSATITNYVLKL